MKNKAVFQCEDTWLGRSEGRSGSVGVLGASPEGGCRVSGALLGSLLSAGVSGWRGYLAQMRLLEAMAKRPRGGWG